MLLNQCDITLCLAQFLGRLLTLFLLLAQLPTLFLQLLLFASTFATPYLQLCPRLETFSKKIGQGFQWFNLSNALLKGAELLVVGGQLFVETFFLGDNFLMAGDFAYQFIALLLHSHLLLNERL